MRLHPTSIMDASLAYSPFQPFFQWQAAHKLTILAYHGINNPETFSRQLDYLVKHTHPISLDDLLGALEGHKQLPKRAVLLTFDDGERSLLEQGVPLLKAHSIPGVAFVIAGLLNTNTPFWWVEAADLLSHGGTSPALSNLSTQESIRLLKRVSDDHRLAILAQLHATATQKPKPVSQLQKHDLAQLENAGIAIGNHTLSHPCLPMCSDEKIKTEITQSHEILSKMLGKAPKVFAYPNGNANRYASTVLNELGYQASFLFDHRLCDLPIKHPHTISRVRVDSTTPLNRFKTIISGLHPAVHHFRGKE